MGLLSSGQSFLNRALGESEGVAVTYSRKLYAATKSTTLTARFGRTLFGGLESQPVSVKWGERDWLVLAADLEFAGVPHTPQRGDRITEADGTVWEAATPDTAEDVWRYSDQTRTLFRIHTKRVVA